MTTTNDREQVCAICLDSQARVAGEVGGKPACEECVDDARRASQRDAAFSPEPVTAAA